MFKKILNFFGILTPEEEFQRGIDYVESSLRKANASELHPTLRRLWNEMDDCFNPTQFDKGMKHRLMQENFLYPNGPL